MKIKFHWGWGISIFYGGFVVVMLTIVFLSTRVQPELVEKNYYESGERYQQRIDEIERTRQLEKKPGLSVLNQKIKVELPYQVVAELLFYRPSDKKLDRKYEMKNQIMWLPKTDFKSGYYLAQMKWEMDGSSYFWEESVVIP